MASKDLILGEATARQRGSGGGMLDAGAAFASGMSTAMEANTLRSAERKRRQNAAATEMKNYSVAMKDDINLENLTPDQKNAVTTFLIDQRNKYANAASLAANISTTDPTYTRLVSEMNSVNRSFEVLKNNLDVYKQNKVQYSNDIKKNTVSAGVDPDEWQATTNLYTGKSIMAVGENGELLFDNNGVWTNYNEMPSYFSKDFATADKILETANQLYNSKSQLTGSRRNLVRNQLLNMVATGGRQTILSLAYDDLITEGGLGSVPEEYLVMENEDMLRNWVVDSYMKMFEATANEGYANYKSTQTSSKSSSSGKSNKKMSYAQEKLYNEQSQINDAIENKSKEITSVNGKIKLQRVEGGYIVLILNDKGNWERQLDYDGLPRKAIDRYDNKSLRDALKIPQTFYNPNWEGNKPINTEYSE
jgi:hypothetical protein